MQNNKLQLIWSFLKDKWMIIFLCIIAIIPRLFFISVNKAVWWDEAQYLLLAKHFLYGTPTTGWFEGRSPLLSSFFSLIFTFTGFNETIGRFIEISLSIATIYLIYALGKKMYSKEVGLIAAAFVSFEFNFFFYSLRILTEIPAAFFITLFVYAAVSLFENKDMNLRSILFTSFAFTMAFLLRYELSFFLFIPFTIISLLNKKYKELGIFLVFVALMSIPLLVYDTFIYNSPLYSLLALLQVGSSILLPATIFDFFVGLLKELGWPMFLALMTGYTFLAFKWKSYKSKFLIIFTLLFMSLFYVSVTVDPRHLVKLVPILSLISALGISKLALPITNINKIKFYPLIISILMVLFVLQPFLSGVNMINIKGSSYSEVKDAALFLKDIADKSSIILTNAQPYVTYYGELNSVEFPKNESTFLEMINNNSTDYIFISLYENVPNYISQNINNYTFLRLIHAQTGSNAQSPLAFVLEVNKTRTT